MKKHLQAIALVVTSLNLDHRFDYFEERWITLGLTTKDNILVVANMFFNENGEEIIRIISARKANLKERIFYEQH